MLKPDILPADNGQEMPLKDFGALSTAQDFLQYLETQQTASGINGNALDFIIHGLHLKLGKDRAVSPPKCLMFGAPKEIDGLSVLQIIRLLIAKEAESAEMNGNGPSLEEVAADPENIRSWHKIKDARAKTKDLIEELKSILLLYVQILTDELAKKETAPDSEFERQFREIPKPATGYEASAKVLRQKFLSKMGVAERDDLRGESPEEIAKAAVSKTVWEEFFDDTKKVLEEKLPVKKRLDVLKMLAGEGEDAAFSFIGSETKPAHITINKAMLDIVGDKTAFLILENYLKARMIADMGFNQKENIENFWSLVSVLQILKNPSSHKKTSTGVIIKRFDSLPELKEKDDDGQKSKHEKIFWGNVKERHIKEQRECAAQQAELLNKIEAVVSFLSEIAGDKKIKNFGNASRICQRCDIKKTEQGVFYSEEITGEQASHEKGCFTGKLRGNFDSRKHDRTLHPQAEVNLIDRANELIRGARDAALRAMEEAGTAQAITEGDRERSRQSAAEAWSSVIEIQRRLDKALEDNGRLTVERRQLATQVEVQTGNLERLRAIMEDTRSQLTAAFATPGTFGNELKEVVGKLLRKL